MTPDMPHRRPDNFEVSAPARPVPLPPPDAPPFGHLAEPVRGPSPVRVLATPDQQRAATVAARQAVAQVPQPPPMGHLQAHARARVVLSPEQTAAADAEREAQARRLAAADARAAGMVAAGSLAARVLDADV